jgi:hypothetical protein
MRVRRRLFAAISLLLALAVPAVSQAAIVWSGCQTIAAVTHQPVGTNILIALTPGLSGCASQGITGAVTFQAGQAGIAAGDLGGLLAASLSAFALGKSVQISYNSTTCFATGIAVGGTSGQCP